jgi:GTP cyclohydrolase II
MFTYLNPDIRERLIDEGKLLRIDSQGRRLDPREQAPPDELTINMLGPIPLPIRIGGLRRDADWYATVRSTELRQVDELAVTLRQSGGQHLFPMLASSMAVNSVLIMGRPHESDNPLVRVHSSCLTGDVFGSERCECGPQLSNAAERISADEAGGLLIYMAGHEGRGIGLWAKAATYLLQDSGEDTYQANQSLGLPDDSRDFSDAAALLHFFVGDRPLRLLTNNPKKISDLAKHGLSHVTPVKHVIGVGDSNRRYLAAKRNWGHRIEPADLEES